jgi:RNA polymerase sigma-70 factor (sigma-E family)
MKGRRQLPAPARERRQPTLRPEPNADAPEDPRGRLTAVFDQHYPHLVRFARHLLDDPGEAEDVVMDAFTGLYRRWTGLWSVDDPYFYLRTSIVNASRSRLRHLRVVRSRPVPADRDVAPAESSALERLEQEEVGAAVRRLSRRQREVLVLRYYDNASEAEIAVVLGISPGAVKSHASRGIAALRRQLGGPA